MQKKHNRLLHEEKKESKEQNNERKEHGTETNKRKEPSTIKEINHTTMHIQSIHHERYLDLRTVTAILQNENKNLRVHALLDDAKTCFMTMLLQNLACKEEQT